MKIKVNDVEKEFTTVVTGFDNNNNLIVKINENEHIVKLVRIQSDHFEYFFDNSYHEAKIIDSTTTELKILLDGQLITLKKHSQLSDVLEKSNALTGRLDSLKTISSQIPGRVISISVNKGDTVKQGDTIVILESMKMQVAIKSHAEGVIRDLKIKEGQSVSRNDVIAILE